MGSLFYILHAPLMCKLFLQHCPCSEIAQCPGVLWLPQGPVNPKLIAQAVHSPPSSLASLMPCSFLLGPNKHKSPTQEPANSLFSEAQNLSIFSRLPDPPYWSCLISLHLPFPKYSPPVGPAHSSCYIMAPAHYSHYSTLLGCPTLLPSTSPQPMGPVRSHPILFSSGSVS